jgi:hypothetical protein
MAGVEIKWKLNVRFCSEKIVMARLRDLKPAFHSVKEEERYRILEAIRNNRLNALTVRRTKTVQKSRQSTEQKAAKELLKALIEQLRSKK